MRAPCLCPGAWAQTPADCPQGRTCLLPGWGGDRLPGGLRHCLCLPCLHEQTQCWCWLGARQGVSPGASRSPEGLAGGQPAGLASGARLEGSGKAPRSWHLELGSRELLADGAPARPGACCADGKLPTGPGALICHQHARATSGGSAVPLPVTSGTPPPAAPR